MAADRGRIRRRAAVFLLTEFCRKRKGKSFSLKYGRGKFSLQNGRNLFKKRRKKFEAACREEAKAEGYYSEKILPAAIWKG